MQQHVQTGYDLVKQIPFLADAAELIWTHHERYDGSGYLRGLKAEQIPIGARIFAVADSLDAIPSDRPYRSALPFESGFGAIHTESGRLYDPQVTAAFFSLPKETWPTICQDATPGHFSPVLAAQWRRCQPYRCDSVPLGGPKALSRWPLALPISRRGFG